MTICRSWLCCPTSTNYPDFVQAHQKSPGSIRPKLLTLARIREFFGDGKKTAGVALVLLGLAFIPVTGGVSLMTLIPGMTLVISSSAGLGIGSGLCLVGLVQLLFSLVSAPAAQVPPAMAHSPVMPDLSGTKPESAGRHPMSEQNAESNRLVSSPAPTKRYFSTRVIARAQELDRVRKEQVSNSRAGWVNRLSDAQRARLANDLSMLTNDLPDHGRLNAQLKQMETDILALDQERLELMEWAQGNRAKNKLWSFAERPLLGVLEKQQADLHQQQELLKQHLSGLKPYLDDAHAIPEQAPVPISIGDLLTIA